MLRYILLFFLLMNSAAVSYSQEASDKKLRVVNLSNTSPFKLLAILKDAGVSKSITVIPTNKPYFDESTVVLLFKHAKSKTKCATPINVLSSTALPPVASTVGTEASRMLLGYLTNYYPPNANEEIPSTAELKKMVLQKIDKTISAHLGQE